MSSLQGLLAERPIAYITRDIERALGLPLDTEGYIIITNQTPEANVLATTYPNNIICIPSETILDTWQLLEHETTKAFLSQTPADILVFKNSTRIERICAAAGWTLLNPSAGLANTIEQKISQITWLGDLAEFFPPFEVKVCGTITESDLPCVIQFNSGHTGMGTVYVDSEEVLAATCNAFPERPIRVTKYIDGPMFTLNSLVTETTVKTSTISYQITGIAPYTTLAFATVGNDWVLPKKLLSKEEEAAIHTMALHIGEKMRRDGWKGLFGIDVVFDTKLRKPYLIEINARQPGSTAYESSLQTTHPTTFEAHLLALKGASFDNDIARVLSGAQLFDRRVDPPVVHHFDSGIMSSHGVLSKDIHI